MQMNDFKNVFSSSSQGFFGEQTAPDTSEIHKTSDTADFVPVSEEEKLLVNRKLIHYYLLCTGLVSKLDPDVTEAQSCLVYPRTPDFEKVLSLDVLYYLSYNYCLISYALLVDYMHIRDYIASAIEKEIMLDSLDEASRNAQRESMKLASGMPVPNESGSVDLTKDWLSIADVDLIYHILRSSFMRYDGTGFESMYNRHVVNLDSDSSEILGYILSNYWYILRALHHNPKFFITLIDIITRLGNDVKNSGGK